MITVHEDRASVLGKVRMEIPGIDAIGKVWKTDVGQKYSILNEGLSQYKD